jgi:choline dehydrogenase-like flavoprotein
VLVERFEETSECVTLRARRWASGVPCSFRASRLYLACGALSTTRLVLDSLGLERRSVPLVSSQYFLLPWLRYTRTPGASREALHTLAQAFVEIDDPVISRHLIHLQVYTYNDLYLRALVGQRDAFAAVLGTGLGPLLERLLVIQGYLHSSETRPSEAVLERGPVGSRLVVRGHADPSGARKVREVAHKLLGLRNLMRAAPVLPLIRVGMPGSGHHVGGTFPMRKSPGSLESDTLGRPLGLRRVHAVDASIFPSIPATTITLSIMANAHRIGTLSDEASP